MARFFFMHLGTLLGVVAYVALAGAGVRWAVGAALAVHVGYMALARSRGELKQFDWALLALFALGTAAAVARLAPVVRLFRLQFGALFWTAFALTALVPPALGREPFTYYYARRQVPAWQQRLPAFHALNRIAAALWLAIFVTNAVLSAAAPLDPRFTLLYPNLLVFLVGVPAPLWLTPLYFRLVPGSLPATAEALVLGMPFAFDRRAAGGARATIQFCLDGAAPSEYWVRVAGGRCEAFEGRAAAPDLTIHAPDAVWAAIARGELDGARALLEGRYRVEGDPDVLARLEAWFPRRR
ncbi:MAG TPA: SCP2 sterol-binding domain-containing protein [Candidatus Binatia bacterium]|jgi:hypothetical protein|nr:SCP2 sterol-binding domain-containing protein [Candidatus Binatia bacterium]